MNTDEAPDLKGEENVRLLLKEETHQIIGCAFDVLYKGRSVGFFQPDLIAFSTVIIDTKTIERITDEERGKMLNYLKVTSLRVGLILNFKHAKLEFGRIVR